MFGSNILEVAIGMILVFLLFSLVAAAVREAGTGLFKGRGRYLRRGIEELLHGDAELVDAFYAHPQIYALYEGTESRKAFPSYIPARNFALALMDMTARGRDARLGSQSGAEAAPLTVETLRRQVSSIGEPRVQRVMLSALDTAHGDIEKVRQSLQDWFDSAMDRVSGHYKRRTQWWLFAIGLVLAILLDIDTLRIAGILYRDPAKRQAAVAIAGRFGEERLAPVTRGDPAPPLPADSARRVIAAALGDVESLSIGIRHRPALPATFDAFIGGLLGWIITAFAISLGAPFWFDTLNKVMVIRSTVKPREKSQEEGSEDRQPKREKSAPSGASASTPGAEGGTANVRVIVAGPTAGGAAGVAIADPEQHEQEWDSGDPKGGLG